jgi:hypothetical protein
LRGPNEPGVSDSTLETNGMHHGEEVIPDVVPTPATETFPEPGAEADEFKVFLRVEGGDRVEAGTYTVEADAHAQAEALMAAAAAATTSAKWPRIGDRYFRPETIVSIDVERSDAPRWTGSTGRASSWNQNQR